jgi:hypothetical protein
MAKKTLAALALEGDYAFPRITYESDEQYLAQDFFKRHPEYVKQAKLELLDR